MRPADLPEWLSSRISEQDTGCWLWTGSTYANGYGRVYDRRTGQKRGAHRVVREVVTGEPIAAGMVTDHLCGVITCVRPEHVDPVTNAENVRRGYLVRGQRPSVREQGDGQVPAPLPAIAPPPRPAPPVRKKREPVADDRKQMNVRLPKDLIDQIDQRRARKDLSRDAWVERALRFALNAQPTTRNPIRPATPRRTP